MSRESKAPHAAPASPPRTLTACVECDAKAFRHARLVIAYCPHERRLLLCGGGVWYRRSPCTPRGARESAGAKAVRLWDHLAERHPFALAAKHRVATSTLYKLSEYLEALRSLEERP